MISCDFTHSPCKQTREDKKMAQVIIKTVKNNERELTIVSISNIKDTNTNKNKVNQEQKLEPEKVELKEVIYDFWQFENFKKNKTTNTSTKNNVKDVKNIKGVGSSNLNKNFNINDNNKEIELQEFKLKKLKRDKLDTSQNIKSQESRSQNIECIDNVPYLNGVEILLHKDTNVEDFDLLINTLQDEISQLDTRDLCTLKLHLESNEDAYVNSYLAKLLNQFNNIGSLSSLSLQFKDFRMSSNNYLEESIFLDLMDSLKKLNVKQLSIFFETIDDKSFIGLCNAIEEGQKKSLTINYFSIGCFLVNFSNENSYISYLCSTALMKLVATLATPKEKIAGKNQLNLHLKLNFFGRASKSETIDSSFGYEILNVSYLEKLTGGCFNTIEIVKMPQINDKEFHQIINTCSREFFYKLKNAIQSKTITITNDFIIPQSNEISAKSNHYLLLTVIRKILEQQKNDNLQSRNFVFDFIKETQEEKNSPEQHEDFQLFFSSYGPHWHNTMHVILGLDEDQIFCTDQVNSEYVPNSNICYDEQGNIITDTKISSAQQNALNFFSKYFISGKSLKKIGDGNVSIKFTEKFLIFRQVPVMLQAPTTTEEEIVEKLQKIQKKIQQRNDVFVLINENKHQATLYCMKGKNEIFKIKKVTTLHGLYENIWQSIEKNSTTGVVDNLEIPKIIDSKLASYIHEHSSYTVITKKVNKRLHFHIEDNIIEIMNVPYMRVTFINNHDFIKDSNLSKDKKIAFLKLFSEENCKENNDKNTQKNIYLFLFNKGEYFSIKIKITDIAFSGDLQEPTSAGILRVSATVLQPLLQKANVKIENIKHSQQKPRRHNNTQLTLSPCNDPQRQLSLQYFEQNMKRFGNEVSMIHFFNKKNGDKKSSDNYEYDYSKFMDLKISMQKN